MSLSRPTRDIFSMVLMIAFASLIVTSIVNQDKPLLEFIVFFFILSLVLFSGLCFITACIEYPNLKKMEELRCMRKKRIDSAYEQLLPDIRNFEKSQRPPRNMQKEIVVSKASAIVSFLVSQNPQADEANIVASYEALGGKKNDIYFAITSYFHPSSMWVMMENNHSI